MINDLLPLYIDGVCSEESKKISRRTYEDLRFLQKNCGADEVRPCLADEGQCGCKRIS